MAEQDIEDIARCASDDLLKSDNSGSLCPAVKSAEMVGDKWTLLILREFMLGSTRYNEFQRALPRISPTVLSKRLKQLELDGLVIRKTTPGEKSSEYQLTKCGREIGPMIDFMAKWGLRWARRRMREEDVDVAAFMWDFHRTLDLSELPNGETVFFINFDDLNKFRKWWIIVSDGIVDLCTEDPGKDVDLYISGELPDIAEVWMGDRAVREAIKADDIKFTGADYLLRSATAWFPQSSYASVRPERFMGKSALLTTE